MTKKKTQVIDVDYCHGLASDYYNANRLLNETEKRGDNGQELYKKLTVVSEAIEKELALATGTAEALFKDAEEQGSSRGEVTALFGNLLARAHCVGQEKNKSKEKD
tara:strand:- start:503 stop:820 length:318 start_codon:yes stop_codon:yes gene_type:complete